MSAFVSIYTVPDGRYTKMQRTTSSLWEFCYGLED